MWWPIIIRSRESDKEFARAFGRALAVLGALLALAFLRLEPGSALPDPADVPGAAKVGTQSVDRP